MANPRKRRLKKRLRAQRVAEAAKAKQTPQNPVKSPPPVEEAKVKDCENCDQKDCEACEPAVEVPAPAPEPAPKKKTTRTRRTRKTPAKPKAKSKDEE